MYANYVVILLEKGVGEGCSDKVFLRFAFWELRYGCAVGCGCCV